MGVIFLDIWRIVVIFKPIIDERMESVTLPMDQQADRTVGGKRFAVALSFPGEYRDRVDRIAAYLSFRFGKENVLYDAYHRAEFARFALAGYLQDLYRNKAELVVVFICDAYLQKDWCNVEWEAISSRLREGDTDSIMILRLDEGGNTGCILNGDGCIDIAGMGDEKVAGLIVERYQINRRTARGRFSDGLYAALKKHLSGLLGEKRRSHPSFQLMEIDDELFPDGIPELHVMEAAGEDNEIKAVGDLVAKSWARAEKNHLMIEGEGGIGKTVTLLSMPEKFVPHEVPAVYVQLHELKGVREEETMEEYIRSQYFPSEDDLFHAFLHLADEPWNRGPNVLLLLDGFNEIAPSRRYTIGQDINRWAGRRGVQIITSSRYDIHSYVPIGGGYGRILLQPLSRGTVKAYLAKWKIPFPETESQWKVIDYPLMLTLYAQTERALRNIEKSEFQEFKENENAGSIIWNYLQREIWRFRRDRRDVVTCVLAAEVIAPCVAFRMQERNVFRISEEQLDELVEAAHKMAVGLERKQFPPHVRRILPRGPLVLPDIDSIHDFIKRELRLFVRRSDGTYSLMHQQFRDALAALHLINAAYNSSGLAEEWRVPVDYYVMSFVAELIDPAHADRLWEHNRQSAARNEVSTINMLELQKRLKKCDFRHLDFSGLDLGNISLYSYKSPGTSALLLPHEARLNNGLAVSSKSFSPQGHSSFISAIVVTPDGKRCISGSHDSTLRVWNLETGQCIRTLEGHRGTVNVLVLTPDGNRCVSGSQDGTLRFWDYETGKCLRTLEGHKGAITAVALAPDGRLCASGSHDGTIRVWDLETGKCSDPFTGHSQQINALLLTPDGKRCISGANDKTVRIWDFVTGRLLKTFDLPGRKISCLALTPSGERLIGGSFDHKVWVWDMETFECLKTLEEHTCPILRLLLTRDGKKCVSSSRDGTICVWDLEKYRLLKKLGGEGGIVFEIMVSPDGRKCISGSRDKLVRVWDMETGQCLKRLEGHEDTIHALAVTPDGSKCISGSHDHSLRIWDLETYQCLNVLEGSKGSEFINTLAFTPDGRKCVSGSGDRTLRVWDLEKKRCLGILEGHSGLVLVQAITPDGKTCLSGSADNTIRIWDLATGDCKGVLEGHRRPVSALAVTTDGKRCISGSIDNSVRIWDMAARQPVRTLEGHTNRISSLAVTPDGKRCLSASLDGTVRIWDLDSFDCLRTLGDHRSGIVAMSLVSHGQKCISISSDKRMILWDMLTCRRQDEWEWTDTNMVLWSIFPRGDRCLGVSINNQLLELEVRDSSQPVEVDLPGSNVKALAVSSAGDRIAAGLENNVIRFYDRDMELIGSMTVLPLSLMGVDFSLSAVPPDLKEVLRQNGAVVDGPTAR